MQMSRTALAVNELKKNNVPFITILTNPTTGGVTASWAMLGDIGNLLGACWGHAAIIIWFSGHFLFVFFFGGTISQ